MSSIFNRIRSHAWMARNKRNGKRDWFHVISQLAHTSYSLIFKSLGSHLRQSTSSFYREITAEGEGCLLFHSSLLSAIFSMIALCVWCLLGAAMMIYERRKFIYYADVGAKSEARKFNSSNLFSIFDFFSLFLCFFVLSKRTKCSIILDPHRRQSCERLLLRKLWGR